MNSVPDIYRILPEVILTLTGVAVMFIDASLPSPMAAPSAWLGGCGWNHIGSLGQPLAALSAPGNRLPLHGRDQRLHHFLPRAYLRHRAGGAVAFARHSSRGQPSPRRVLCARSLWRCGHVPAHRRARATGRLHCSRISPISTYILAGYRKNTARGPEAAIKYFLSALSPPPSFSTASR